MKLSEMNNEQLSRCLVMMSEPMNVLAQDAEFISAFQGYFLNHTTRENTLVLAMSFIGTFVPILLGTHEKEMRMIVAGLTEKTVDEVRKMNGLKTILELKKSVDKDLIDFFR